MMKPPVMPYPATPEIEETVTTGGVSFNDIYRWLAEDNPTTLQWQQAQDELAQSTLASGGVPRFEALLQAGFVNMYTFYAPQPVAGRWFHRETPPGAKQPVVSVSDQPDGPGRVLFDLATLDNKDALLQHVVPSPDGSRIVVVVALNDAAHTLTVLVIETATGRVEHRLAAQHYMMAPAWLPDGGGFLFAGPTDAETAQRTDLPAAPGMRIFEQRLDAALTRTLVPLAHAHSVVVPTVTADQRHAVISENQVALHPTWIRRLVPGAAWQPFLDASFGRVKGTLVGDEFIAIHSDANSPAGRLVAIPVASPRDRATWRELLPAGTATLASVTPVAGKLVLGESVEGHSRLRVLRLDGMVEHEIGLPESGGIGRFALGFISAIIEDLVWAGGHDVSFVFSSLRHAPAAYRYDMRTGALEALGEPSRTLTGASLATLEARADDGARVVYHVVRPRDAGGPGPTIVTGYGGFNVPWLPSWSAMAAAWVDAGGTWVHAHLRGGGEFGEEFWRSGRMANKANTFEDLYGVLRDLVRRGVTTVEQLGIFGTSNGGVLVCAAISQQPELFTAAVPQVPVTDVHDCVRDPLTHGIAVVDYGNAQVPEESQWLMRWSPYRTLRRGTRFPAVLIDSSANDTTCPPWHGRKFAAFLQNHGAPDSGPVLLRVRADAGHNEMSQAQFIRRDAEELAFMAQHLGLAE